MRALNNTKKTRFKLAVYTDIFLALLATYAVSEGLETVASTCVAGILTITTGYIGGDSYRKSESV